ncbi:MAG: hypothetical protein FJ304_24490, partial [Planctomycetes bacterium]|nr:hypothetical protein [Planctomycetota bacterium]
MSSFKVACPSCEAPVLIKDPKLVGTKVECPKCKYRFKVEVPPDAPAGDPKKPDPKAKPAEAKADAKAKPTGSGKKKKLVPILVGAGAVVLLVVVGVFAFGGKKPNTKGGPGPGVQNNNNNNNNNNNGSDPNNSNPDSKDPKQPPPGPPPIPYSTKTTTNLLPGSAVAVYRLNMDKVRETPAYSALADQKVRALFTASMGFAPDEIETYVHCYAGAGRDPFGVIKLKTPIKPADVTGKMALQPKPKKVKKYELHAVRANYFAAAFSQAMAMRALFGDTFTALPPAGAANPMGVCVYDSQHVLMGDLALLEQFLNALDANGDPPFESVLNTEAGGGGPAPAPTPGPGPAPAPLPTPGVPPKSPPKNPAPAPKTPAPGDKPFTSFDSYRSLEFPLKKALDDMETGTPPALVYAEKFDPKEYDVRALRGEYALMSGTLDAMVKRQPRYVSANVVVFSERRLIANLRVTFGTPGDAQAVVKDQLTTGLALVAEALTLYLSSTKTDAVEFRNLTLGAPPGTGTPPGTGFPPMGGTGIPPMGGTGPGGPPPMPGGGPGSAPP